MRAHVLDGLVRFDLLGRKFTLAPTTDAASVDGPRLLATAVAVAAGGLDWDRIEGTWQVLTTAFGVMGTPLPDGCAAWPGSPALVALCPARGKRLDQVALPPLHGDWASGLPETGRVDGLEPVLAVWAVNRAWRGALAVVGRDGGLRHTDDFGSVGSVRSDVPARLAALLPRRG